MTRDRTKWHSQHLLALRVISTNEWQKPMPQYIVPSSVFSQSHGISSTSVSTHSFRQHVTQPTNLNDTPTYRETIIPRANFPCPGWTYSNAFG